MQRAVSLLICRAALRRLARKPLDLDRAACDRVVIQPEEAEACDPIYYLDGQLDKVTGTTPGPHSLEQMFVAIRQRIVRHAPVIKFVIDNCIVSPLGLDTAHGFERKQALIEARLGAIERISSGLYCMSQISRKFFGHWLQDACSTAFLQCDESALLLDTPIEWPHASQYVEAFGLRPARSVVQFVDRLTLFRDLGQGSSKRQRYSKMRDALAQAFGGSYGARDFIYFRRGATGVERVIENEETFLNAMMRRGFEIFDLGGKTAGEIFRRFRRALVVVSVDGSHLNHLYFSMPPASSLITLIPSDGFNLNQKGYCQAARLRHGFTVMAKGNGGYIADPEEVLRTLDLIGNG